jgi:hypothetical protein
MALGRALRAQLAADKAANPISAAADNDKKKKKRKKKKTPQ